MTRSVVLDTETTGLEVEQGDRVIEIGCVELVDRRPSGRTFHCYLNPQRAIGAGALAIHGITDEFLRDKPRFADVAADFITFIEGSELLIHNAPFDVGFLDTELRLAGAKYGQIRDHANVVDTYTLARTKYPGQKNGLDALCKRVGVDNSRRDLHGALLDAQLLAEVWIAMTAGQGALALGGGARREQAAGMRTVVAPTVARPCVRRASAAESAAHAARIAAIDSASVSGSVWSHAQADG